MSKVSTILTRVRDTLADPSGDRWDDARIIRAMNEAQRDICLKANLLRQKTQIALNPNRALYNLLSDTLIVTRVLYGTKSVELKSHDDMDKIDEEWETHTGTEVECIVYDKTNMGTIKIYPMLEEVSGTSAYGAVTAMELADFDSSYGTITAIGNLVDTDNSIEITGDRLVIYYLAKPKELTSVTDSLSIDDIWDTAIKHHVCGMLLRDDADTQNRAFGNEELQLYTIELGKSISVSSKDFSSSSKYTTAYRSF